MKNPVLNQEQAEFLFEHFSNILAAADKPVKVTVKTDTWFAVIFEDKTIYASGDCAHERHDSLEAFADFYAKHFELTSIQPGFNLDRLVNEAKARLEKQLQDSVDEALSRVRFGFIVGEQNLKLQNLIAQCDPENETEYQTLLRLRIKAKQTGDKALALALKLKMNEVYFGKFPHHDPRLYGHLDPSLYGHPVLDYGVTTEKRVRREAVDDINRVLARREAIDLYGFMFNPKTETIAKELTPWHKRALNWITRPFQK
jgi:hypothetical protein